MSENGRHPCDTHNPLISQFPQLQLVSCKAISFNHCVCSVGGFFFSLTLLLIQYSTVQSTVRGQSRKKNLRLYVSLNLYILLYTVLTACYFEPFFYNVQIQCMANIVRVWGEKFGEWLSLNQNNNNNPFDPEWEKCKMFAVHTVPSSLSLYYIL